MKRAGTNLHVHAGRHTMTQHNECGKTTFGIGSKRSAKKQQQNKNENTPGQNSHGNEHVQMMFRLFFLSFCFHFRFIFFSPSLE